MLFRFCPSGGDFGKGLGFGLGHVDSSRQGKRFDEEPGVCTRDCDFGKCPCLSITIIIPDFAGDDHRFVEKPRPGLCAGNITKSTRLIFHVLDSTGNSERIGEGLAGKVKRTRLGAGIGDHAENLHLGRGICNLINEKVCFGKEFCLDSEIAGDKQPSLSEFRNFIVDGVQVVNKHLTGLICLPQFGLNDGKSAESSCLHHRILLFFGDGKGLGKKLTGTVGLICCGQSDSNFSEHGRFGICFFEIASRYKCVSKKLCFDLSANNQFEAQNIIVGRLDSLCKGMSGLLVQSRLGLCSGNSAQSSRSIIRIAVDSSCNGERFVEKPRLGPSASNFAVNRCPIKIISFFRLCRDSRFGAGLAGPVN